MGGGGGVKFNTRSAQSTRAQIYKVYSSYALMAHIGSRQHVYLYIFHKVLTNWHFGCWFG